MNRAITAPIAVLFFAGAVTGYLAVLPWAVAIHVVRKVVG